MWLFALLNFMSSSFPPPCCELRSCSSASDVEHPFLPFFDVFDVDSSFGAYGVEFPCHADPDPSFDFSESCLTIQGRASEETGTSHELLNVGTLDVESSFGGTSEESFFDVLSNSSLLRSFLQCVWPESEEVQGSGAEVEGCEGFEGSEIEYGDLIDLSSSIQSSCELQPPSLVVSMFEPPVQSSLMPVLEVVRCPDSAVNTVRDLERPPEDSEDLEDVETSKDVHELDTCPASLRLGSLGRELSQIQPMSQQNVQMSSQHVQKPSEECDNHQNDSMLHDPVLLSHGDVRAGNCECGPRCVLCGCENAVLSDDRFCDTCGLMDFMEGDAFSDHALYSDLEGSPSFIQEIPTLSHDGHRLLGDRFIFVDDSSPCPSSSSCVQMVQGFLRSAPSEVEMSEWWLLDSGASRSVISERFVENYHPERSRKLESPLCFSAANGTKIHVTQECFVPVILDLLSNGRQIRQRCSLRCLIAPVEHNLLSVTQLARMGWSLLISPEETVLKYRELTHYPIVWGGVPWLKVEIPSENARARPSSASDRSTRYRNWKSSTPSERSWSSRQDSDVEADSQS